MIVKIDSLFRRCAFIALGSASLATALLFAWALTDKGRQVTDLARVPSLGIYISRVAGCLGVAKFPVKDIVPYERIDHADGSVTRIYRGLGYERVHTRHTDGRSTRTYKQIGRPELIYSIENAMLARVFRARGLIHFSWDARRGRLILRFPAWVPPMALGAYPAIAFARGPVRRRRRRQKGFCVRCGYNLTGNVSGVCPECGAKLEKP